MSDSESRGRPLRDVYSVSLGVALVLAVEQVVDLEGDGVPIHGTALLTFLAFVASAFSLYHWAVRFIDLSSGAEKRPARAVITSLVVGSTELLLLIALSILIARPSSFLMGLAALLAFEVAAGLALLWAGAYGGAEPFAKSYVLINTLALVGAVLGLVGYWVIDDSSVAGVFALVVSWARAIAFYKVGYRILFE